MRGFIRPSDVILIGGVLALSSAGGLVACGRSDPSAFDSKTEADAAADAEGDAADSGFEEIAAPDANVEAGADAESDAGAQPDASVCVPGAQLDCYSGSASTRNVGACTAGLTECVSDGSGFGPCVGEVVPSAELCGTATDEDCDGLVNEDCECTPGTTETCYDGPAETYSVGPCHGGTHACTAEGTWETTCVGQVLPGVEDCASPFDEDCDGLTDEADSADCLCKPGSTDVCYSGPPGTQNVGKCFQGFKACSDDGQSYGACYGDLLPNIESCVEHGDEDCDGLEDEEGEGCICDPYAPGESCYSGPPGTAGVGACKAGQHTCYSGVYISPSCDGERVPSFENCADPGDEDCNGSASPACAPLEWAAILKPDLAPRLIGLPNEDVILAGHTQAPSINLGGQTFAGANTNTDLYAARWSANGTHLWSQRSSGTGTESLGGITRNGNGALLVGYCNGDLALAGFSTTCALDDDAFVIALDGNGALAWARTLNGPGTQGAYAVDVDPAGNVFVAGRFTDQLTIGPLSIASAGSNVFFLKLAPDGTPLWIKAFPITQQSGSVDYSLLLQVVASGTHPFLIGTSSYGTIDFQGTTFQGYAWGRLFVTSLDASGTVQWMKAADAIPGFGMQMSLNAATRVPLDSSLFLGGSIYGAFSWGGGPTHQTNPGQESGFALHLADDGTEIWGTITPAAPLRSASASSTGVAIGGHLTNTGDVGHGPVATDNNVHFGYVLKRDSNDSPTWSRILSTQYGNASETTGVLLHPSGAVVATGGFVKAIDAGGMPLTSTLPATFLIRYSP